MYAPTSQASENDASRKKLFRYRNGNKSESMMFSKKKVNQCTVRATTKGNSNANANSSATPFLNKPSNWWILVLHGKPKLLSSAKGDELAYHITEHTPTQKSCRRSKAEDGGGVPGKKRRANGFFFFCKQTGDKQAEEAEGTRRYLKAPQQ
jgi:hypothetical protein